MARQFPPEWYAHQAQRRKNAKKAISQSSGKKVFQDKKDTERAWRSFDKDVRKSSISKRVHTTRVWGDPKTKDPKEATDIGMHSGITKSGKIGVLTKSMRGTKVISSKYHSDVNPSAYKRYKSMLMKKGKSTGRMSTTTRLLGDKGGFDRSREIDRLLNKIKNR